MPKKVKLYVEESYTLPADYKRGTPVKAGDKTPVYKVVKIVNSINWNVDQRLTRDMIGDILRYERDTEVIISRPTNK